MDVVACSMTCYGLTHGSIRGARKCVGVASHLTLVSVAIKGQAPSPRYHHSAVVYNNNMFIFGMSAALV